MPLPRVSDRQLDALRYRRDNPRKMSWPGREEAALVKKELLEKRAYGVYEVTPLGYDVLAARERKERDAQTRR